MKNFEIILIRGATIAEPMKQACKYPNVGKVYSMALGECIICAQTMFPHVKESQRTAANLRERDLGESNEVFALRCVAGLEQIFKDLSQSSDTKAALVTDEETIVTLVAGCGMPQRDPLDCRIEPGDGWVIRMSAYLWQKGKVFEVLGKLSELNA
jgi:hypothetical protein